MAEASTIMTSTSVPDKNKKRAVVGGWSAAYKKRLAGR